MLCLSGFELCSRWVPLFLFYAIAIFYPVVVLFFIIIYHVVVINYAGLLLRPA